MYMHGSVHMNAGADGHQRGQILRSCYGLPDMGAGNWTGSSGGTARALRC